MSKDEKDISNKKCDKPNEEFGWGRQLKLFYQTAKITNMSSAVGEKSIAD